MLVNKFEYGIVRLDFTSRFVMFRLRIVTTMGISIFVPIYICADVDMHEVSAACPMDHSQVFFYCAAVHFGEAARIIKQVYAIIS